MCHSLVGFTAPHPPPKMSLMDDWDDAPAYAAQPAAYEDTVYEDEDAAGAGADPEAADVYGAVSAAVDDAGDEEMFTLEKLEQNFFDGYGGIKVRQPPPLPPPRPPAAAKPAGARRQAAQ